MRNRSTKRLHSYVLFLLLICILLGLRLDDLADFFVGFYAGWNGMSTTENARVIFGNTGEIIGRIVVGSAFVGIIVLCYIKLQKKVTRPIECLARDMKEVSQGNLEVRTPVDGDFEIAEIQKSFNTMVEKLEYAQKDREATERRNQQLYAGIAHDLKTPMTVIMGYAKVLEQDSANSAEDKKRYTGMIIEQTEHTNALLDALLSYTKLENPEYQLKKEKADIVECLRECTADYYPILENAKIKTELRLPETGIQYDFDSVEMKRVFSNLLSNMVKHNPEGICSIIQLDKIYDEEKDTENIRIIIADNGPKIPDRIKHSLFDAFVVGDDSRTTRKGSGLGLSISKKIVEKHGGNLSYDDDWKDGMKCFIIELK